MVAAYLSGADYVIGSRYVKGGSIPKEWEFSRKAVSFLGNLFIRLVLLKPKIHDLTTGFRLTRVKGVLDQINLEHLMEPARFAHKVDLLYQSIKNSKNTVEVPLEFASRTKENPSSTPKKCFPPLRWQSFWESKTSKNYQIRHSWFPGLLSQRYYPLFLYQVKLAGLGGLGAVYRTGHLK